MYKIQIQMINNTNSFYLSLAVTRFARSLLHGHRVNSGDSFVNSETKGMKETEARAHEGISSLSSCTNWLKDSKADRFNYID